MKVQGHILDGGFELLILGGTYILYMLSIIPGLPTMAHTLNCISALVASIRPK